MIYGFTVFFQYRAFEYTDMESPASPQANAGVIGMAKEHLGLALASLPDLVFRTIQVDVSYRTGCMVLRIIM